MKRFINKGFFVFVISNLFILLGCSSMKPISFALVEDKSNSVSISFAQGNPGVKFLSYNNINLPESDGKTYWDPIFFPSGIPLEITVHAYYSHGAGGSVAAGVVIGGLVGGIIAPSITSRTRNARSVDDEIIFSCPPLEAGKEYKLSLVKGEGVPGKNTLVLTNTSTNEVILEQEFFLD